MTLPLERLARRVRTNTLSPSPIPGVMDAPRTSSTRTEVRAAITEMKQKTARAPQITLGRNLGDDLAVERSGIIINGGSSFLLTHGTPKAKSKRDPSLF